jgi:hypothetical protein
VTRIAVIYYSATGNVHALARAVADGAAAEGADVRLRHVAELPPELLISFKQHWGRHRSELEGQPDASIEPLGYTAHEAFNGVGNPYGTSYTSDHRIDGQPDEVTLMVARAQGARLARVAGVIAAARADGRLTATAAAKTNSSNGKD